MPYYGMLLGENMGLNLAVVLIVFLALGYVGAPFLLWSVALVTVAFMAGAPLPVVMGLAAILALFLIKPLRAMVISLPIMKLFKVAGFLPNISQTERTALEAGVVWSEAELFSGKPHFSKIIRNQPNPQPTAEEKAFLEGPCEELCRMIDDWEIWKGREIPQSVLQFVKDKGFLGMIIPKEYGGLGFSAYAHSEVIQKISTRSVAASITVMVPNSLGPAELLIHYGTEEQKKRHLPRLARGEDVPCFGLTEPQAGSDAGSITSTGVLFKGPDGKIKIRLNWRKRWITLAAISTTIGLAFRLRDPDNLLGKGTEDLGITCALIPAKTPGVVLGRRHDPLGVPFYNCPTEGKDVVVDAEEAIIGGLAMAGQGWMMLMECLAAGRGISLPAQSTGGLKLVTRVASNHALIRKQFGVSIGRFEGVEEPLARVAGYAYLCEAMRRYTLSALDQGFKPPVVTAIAKYNATELFRRGINDGMDIMGGAGISLGSRNILASSYIAAPISITVEGANILTRTLIIFGQGALRAHPFAYKEVTALEKGDVQGFDRAFWGHMGHVLRNKCRAFVLSLTRGHFAFTPGGGGTRRYYQKLAWASATFAIMADLAMALLGGKLKFKEKLTGRFADILSWMYIATAVLHRFEHEGRKKEDKIYVDYAMAVAFSNIQKAFEGIFANFEAPFFVSWIFKGPLYWWSAVNTLGKDPGDHLTHAVADSVLKDSEQRDRLTQGIFISKDPQQALGRLEAAFKTIYRSEAVEKKVRKAVRAKTLPKIKGKELYSEALNKGVITQEEFKDISLAEELRWDAIQVDDFNEEEYHANSAKKTSTGAGGFTTASHPHVASSRQR